MIAIYKGKLKNWDSIDNFPVVEIIRMFKGKIIRILMTYGETLFDTEIMDLLNVDIVVNEGSEGSIVSSLLNEQTMAEYEGKDVLLKIEEIGN
ncbi:MAG: hypothetical protein ACTSWL_01360 [Promethearchaeota archaeon]